MVVVSINSKIQARLQSASVRKPFWLALAFLAWLNLSPALAVVERSDASADAQRTGVPLYEWQDDAVKDPKAIVIAVHGFTQQGGCFGVLAKALADQGYLFVAPDLRGHGRWTTGTGSTNNDLNMSCEDLSNIIARLRKEHPHAKIFCLGESCGSAVVLRAVSEDARGIKGIILCAAGVQPHIHSPANLGSKFVMGMAKLVTPVDLSDYYSHYVSDDKRIADEMINDPLGKGHQSGLSLIGTMNFISQMPDVATTIPRSIPVLVIQGAEDQVVDPKSVLRVVSSFKTTDKTLEEIPGSGHVLVGTSFIKPQVMGIITSWLANHDGINNNGTNTATLPGQNKSFGQKLKSKFHL